MPSTAAPDDVVVVIDAVSPPADALAASLDRLARWSLERGVRWSANEVEVKTIRLSNHATHRGVFATRAIDGDVQKDLIVIPRSAMIACDGLDVAGDGEERRADEAEARDELALKLLRHRSAGARDAFAPYVESMPKKYNLLQSWSEDEIEELQDARAKALAFRRKAETRRAFERVKDQVRDIIRSGRDDDNVVNDDEIFDAYEWARATVSSRAVSVPFHAAGALCPMGDMFNYAPHDPPILIDVIGAPTFGMREETTSEGDAGAKTTPIPGDGAYDVESETFAFRTALQPRGRGGVGTGMEIYVCYGEYSNIELLDYYGFCLAPDENPQDGYVLDVRVDAERVAPLKVYVGGFSWNDLADVRIAFATRRGPRKNEKHLRDVARRGGALGLDEEADAFEAIREAAAAALLHFPTTAKTDTEALEDVEKMSVLSENVKLAITWRLCAKRILQRAYKWADARVTECAAARDVSRGVSRVSLARVSTPKPC